MSRQVSHDGRGALHVRFPYDRRLVDLVKSLPDRRWLGDEKIWRVPDTSVVVVVELLHTEGFRFDETVCRLYLEGGGTIDLVERTTIQVRPSGRGLFDGLGEAVDGEARPASRLQPNDYTVGRLNLAVRSLIEEAFPAPIWIVGEISGFNKAAHKRVVGFHLVERDARGQEISKVSATLFDDERKEIERRLVSAGSPFQLEDEVEVRVLARVDLYDPWGQYRVCVEDLDVSYTLGEAARRREEIVRRLTERGLVGVNTGLLFPALPLRVGVVTSLGSDAYNDVLRSFQESGFAFSVTVHGARVQGRSTEASVLNAIDWFRARVDAFDVVLICRGGGSRTDLGWFDSEALGEAVATFPLPVVVGIGHEQDLSVLDFVGWKRKTPTAAAAFLVEKVQQAWVRIDESSAGVLSAAALRIEAERRAGTERARRLVRATRTLLDVERVALRTRSTRTAQGARTTLLAAGRDLSRLTLSLPRAAERLLARRSAVIEQLIRQVVQGGRRDFASCARRVAELSVLVFGRSRARLAIETERAETRMRRLHLLDPRRVVERGYAILRGDGGGILKDAEAVPAGTVVRAELRRGTLRLLSEGPETSESGGA